MLRKVVFLRSLPVFSVAMICTGISARGLAQDKMDTQSSAPAEDKKQPVKSSDSPGFEKGSSGWHRAQRPDSYLIGLGAGYQLSGVPLYRLQFGKMFSNLGVVYNWDIGASSSDDLKISSSSSINFHYFTGNSQFFDLGWGSETRSAVFTPRRIVNGEVKDGLVANGTSEITFVHLGVGNKWQWGGLGLSVEWVGIRGTTSRKDKVEATELVSTTLADGTTTVESRPLKDEASVAMNTDILRKKVGGDGSLRLMFTTLSYSF